MDLRTENRAIIFEKNWISKVIAVLNWNTTLDDDGLHKSIRGTTLEEDGI